MKNLVGILNWKNTTTKVKISVDGLNSTVARTEERITPLEERTIEITQSEETGIVDLNVKNKSIKLLGKI